MGFLQSAIRALDRPEAQSHALAVVCAQIIVERQPEVVGGEAEGLRVERLVHGIRHLLQLALEERVEGLGEGHEVLEALEVGVIAAGGAQGACLELWRRGIVKTLNILVPRRSISR